MSSLDNVEFCPVLGVRQCPPDAAWQGRQYLCSAEGIVIFAIYGTVEIINIQSDRDTKPLVALISVRPSVADLESANALLMRFAMPPAETPVEEHLVTARRVMTPVEKPTPFGEVYDGRERHVPRDLLPKMCSHGIATGDVVELEVAITAIAAVLRSPLPPVEEVALRNMHDMKDVEAYFVDFDVKPRSSFFKAKVGYSKHADCYMMQKVKDHFRGSPTLCMEKFVLQEKGVTATFLVVYGPSLTRDRRDSTAIHGEAAIFRQSVADPLKTINVRGRDRPVAKRMVRRMLGTRRKYRFKPRPELPFNWDHVCFF
ncbi:hypothetical protein NM688_g1620 [Phlebia brevispora]|uniref:Uncharacterized protein n=1 Tax=Phlebia brevispora TaxID=194682 RepID=A0ACC1TAZ8_9APHY|nr:hypothetical protein NM688_g1620 [Phlebia brevispora]